jgi:predicted dithiol-disulfide oxidoreductase (DUF899 family)
VAAQRRALPPGGEAPPYAFPGEDGRTLKLADIFGAHDTLVSYFWMYGPQRERPCPMCTAFLGSMDIPARDITQRVGFAVFGRSPVARRATTAGHASEAVPPVRISVRSARRCRLPGLRAI